MKIECNTSKLGKNSG